MSKKSVSNTSVKHGKFSIMPLGVGGEGLFIPSMFEGEGSNREGGGGDLV